MVSHPGCEILDSVGNLCFTKEKSLSFAQTCANTHQVQVWLFKNFECECNHFLFEDRKSKLKLVVCYNKVVNIIFMKKHIIIFATFSFSRWPYNQKKLSVTLIVNASFQLVYPIQSCYGVLHLVFVSCFEFLVKRFSSL